MLAAIVAGPARRGQQLGRHRHLHPGRGAEAGAGEAARSSAQVSRAEPKEREEAAASATRTVPRRRSALEVEAKEGECSRHAARGCGDGLPEGGGGRGVG